MAQRDAFPGESPVSATAILLVDSNAATRKTLASQLESLGCDILHASDGISALRALRDRPVQLVVTELYVSAGDADCLVDAIRSNGANNGTRIIALTDRSRPSDREWALRAGADAYLIKPTRPQRLRYVVGRLSASRTPTAGGARTERTAITRMDSLEDALRESEVGARADVGCIVFGRSWWERLPEPQRSSYRRRAKAARVSLRSDSKLKGHFVEVRLRSHGQLGLSTEQPESPYRR
jgi:CheY-like chemotaxis protein